MRNILSKLDRNLRVCRDQMRAYIEELINIVFPDIADAARDFDIRPSSRSFLTSVRA